MRACFVLAALSLGACNDDDTASGSASTTGAGAATSASASSVATGAGGSGGSMSSGGYSLRFFGNGVNDIDRVKIPIDAPPVPADIGAGDFTIEVWLKATTGDNLQSGCAAVSDGWIYGNIFIDRDVFGNGEYGDYGLSLFTDGVSFGAAVGAQGVGLCSNGSIDDGAWHHLAVTRDAASGSVRLYIDGALEAKGAGPTGDMSYADGRATSYPNSDPFLVLGAEKHDAGSAYPPYTGFMDELRLSTVVRYTASFAPPTAPFAGDAQTAALYHFDEGSGTVLGDSSGSSNGELQVGGDPEGPIWSTDTPF